MDLPKSVVLRSGTAVCLHNVCGVAVPSTWKPTGAGACMATFLQNAPCSPVLTGECELAEGRGGVVLV